MGLLGRFAGGNADAAFVAMMYGGSTQQQQQHQQGPQHGGTSLIPSQNRQRSLSAMPTLPLKDSSLGSSSSSYSLSSSASSSISPTSPISSVPASAALNGCSSLFATMTSIQHVNTPSLTSNAATLLASPPTSSSTISETLQLDRNTSVSAPRMHSLVRVPVRVPLWPESGDFGLYRQLVEDRLRSVLFPLSLGRETSGRSSNGTSTSAPQAPVERFVFGNSLTELFDKCEDEYQAYEGISFIFVVQLGLTWTESADGEEVRAVAGRARRFLRRKKSTLLCLAVGDSEELANWIAYKDEDLKHADDVPKVLCWSNPFANAEQQEFAFSFCYHVIDQCMSSSNPQQRRPDGAFLRSLAHFERKLQRGGHTYSLGSDAHGEPCLYPNFPARKFRKWSYWAYERKLGQAAGACASTIGALLDGTALDTDAARANELQRQPLFPDGREVAFCFGSYFGWLALMRYSKDYNRLSRLQGMDGVEYAFSGAGNSLGLDKLQKIREEQQTLVPKGTTLREFDDTYHEPVIPDVLQLLKIDMLSLGLLMHTDDHSGVISRHQFFQRLGKVDQEDPADQEDLLAVEFNKLTKELKERIADLRDKPKNIDAKRFRRRLTWICNNFQVMHRVLQKDVIINERVERMQAAASAAETSSRAVFLDTHKAQSSKLVSIGNLAQVTIHAVAAYLLAGLVVGFVRFA